MHDVAGVDEAKACLPREGRSDCRIAHLRLGIVDRRLIAFDLRDELIDRRLLGVELLPRDGILLREPGVAHKVELRVLEARLVLRLLRNRLIERRLIGAWIDLHENIAVLDHLALFEVDLDDLAIDSASHKNGLVRFDDAEPVQIDWEIGFFRLRDGDGDGRRPLKAIGLARTCHPGFVAEKMTPAEVAAECDRGHGGYQRPAATEEQ